MNPKWILLSVEPILRYCQMLCFAKSEPPSSVITNTTDGPSDKECCQKFKCLFGSWQCSAAGTVLGHEGSGDAACTKEILLQKLSSKSWCKSILLVDELDVHEHISNSHSCSRAGTFRPHVNL